MNSLVLRGLLKAVPFAMVAFSLLLMAHGVFGVHGVHVSGDPGGSGAPNSHMGLSGDPGGPGAPNFRMVTSGDPGGSGAPN
jgi:hypothetical protein